jgi:hypothetical protein
MSKKQNVKLRPGRPEGLNYATLSVTVTPEQFSFIRQHVNASDYHRALLDTLMELAELYASRRTQYEKRDDITGVPIGQLARFFRQKNDEASRKLGSYDWGKAELNDDGEPVPFGYTPEDLAEAKVRLNLVQPVIAKIRELDANIAKELEKLENLLIGTDDNKC